MECNQLRNKLTLHDGNFFQELKCEESQTKCCRLKEGLEKGFGYKSFLRSTITLASTVHCALPLEGFWTNLILVGEAPT